MSAVLNSNGCSVVSEAREKNPIWPCVEHFGVVDNIGLAESSAGSIPIVRWQLTVFMLLIVGGEGTGGG